MAEAQSLPGVPTYKDRSTGLMACGIVQVLMGFCMAGMALLMTVMALLPPAPNAGMEPRAMVPAVLMYLLLAVAGVWLGIGSCLARRWARALTLMLAWMGLLVGLVALAAMAALAGHFREMLPRQPEMPAGAVVVMQVVMFATVLVIYILVPGIFVLFYQSKHVWATCQARDPKIRWTDKAPLPVIALSLCLAFGAAYMPTMAAYNFTIPLFGKMIQGMPGAAVCLAMSLINAILAYQLYKLRPAAWWATLIFFGLGSLSSLVTFSRIHMLDLYKAMNMPEKQLEMMRPMLPLMERMIPWGTAASMGAALVYLLWIRRYFTGKNAD